MDSTKLSYNEEFEEDIYEFEALDDAYDDSEIKKEVYNSEDLISKPIKSEQCTLDENIVLFHHSFGYDCCSRFFNICAADDHTVVYASGSFIHMLDVDTGNLSFRKCAGDGGIGHITKNPAYSHIAVGENCSNPSIIVYEWPTFNVISVLKEGTKKRYNWLTYSKNGNYLCSQGGEPDNTITIWDWDKSRIILRTKSHSQDVYVCRFSNFIPDHLTTAGSGHIKFWKMAKTFTGLKLQGRLGRFGKTEISNVIGTFSMPDEKVISGCEWGNILVWDEELIKIQVMRKGRKPCHLAPIIMFLYSEQNMELTSVSMDGTIKSWYYYTVDMADPPENDRVLEIEPSFTITVQDAIGTAKIMGMCRINDDVNSYDYFIQDGNGGIWFADIEISANAKPLKRLAKFHGDTITSLQPSPVGYYIATSSLDGWFHLYDIVNRKLVFTHDFKKPITSLIWLPLKMAKSGSIFVAGFKTGLLKMFLVPLEEVVNGESVDITQLQATKPHKSTVSHLTVNNNFKIVVSGSEDCSVFVYKLLTNPLKLEPVGMYPLPGAVTFIYWKPSKKRTALVSCASGHILELTFPTSRPLYTKQTFTLNLEPRVIETKSIKSEIIRNEFIKKMNEKKEEKKMRKREKLKILKENNPGVEIDEELYYIDSEEDEEPPKIYIPPEPNQVLFAIYTPNEKTVWVSIDGYDAGYLYEYDLDTSKPVNFIFIPDKIDLPLSSVSMFQSDLLMVILMGFADGRMRVTNLSLEDPSNFNDFVEYSMHDNITGIIKCICFSHDCRMLYTLGEDGNVFSFNFQCDYNAEEKCALPVTELPPTPILTDEDFVKTKEDLILSLEERKINKEKWKAMNLANKEKNKIRDTLNLLKTRFKNVLTNNKSLPEPLQLPRTYFELDERITSSLIAEAEVEMNVLRSKLAYDHEKSELALRKVKNYFVADVVTSSFSVHGISKDITVESIDHKEHREVFGNLVSELLNKKHPKRNFDKFRDINSVRRRKSTILDKPADDTIHKLAEWEVFLRNVRELYDSLPKNVQTAIDKFTERKHFEENKKLELKNMVLNKPDGDKFNTEEETAIDVATNMIGDINLKSSPNYKVPPDDTVLMEDKYEEYMDIHKEISKIKSKFNGKLLDLKQQKISLIQDYKQFLCDVRMIENELNDSTISTPDDFPTIPVDKFIDVSSYLLLYPEYCSLYSEPTSSSDMQEYNPKPSILENLMKDMRREKLKYKHRCLHESILAKIDMFDNRLIKLGGQKNDLLLRITFLELFTVTLEEEMLILNDFDLLEDQYSYDLHVITGKQNAKAEHIMYIEDNVRRNYKIIENKTKEAIDIQNLFEIEIRNNSFAKHLRKIFKKKYKPIRAKLDDEDSLSSSSSDDDDDSDSDTNDDVSIDSNTLFGQLLFDETVLPEGCDPKLFALTFELRSNRYEIEQFIESTYREVEVLKKTLSVELAELNVIDNNVLIKTNQLDAYRVEKKLKLNDIETTVLLTELQMTKAKLLSNSILVMANVMQNMKSRRLALEREKKEIKEKMKELMLHSRRLNIDIEYLREIYKNCHIDIKDEMITKFRMIISLDDMEMTIIKYMITQAKSNADELKSQFNKQIDTLKKEFRKLQEFLMNLLKINTSKTITLAALKESIQQLGQAIAVQQKKSKAIHDISSNASIYEADIATLQDVLDALLAQKQELNGEINAIKYKGKMFPPIVKPSVDKVKPESPVDVDIQSATLTSQEAESRDSWSEGEEDAYNMEFNMELKKTSSIKQQSQIRSQQSFKLTKQASRYSYESDEETYDDEEWRNYKYLYSNELPDDVSFSKATFEDLQQIEQDILSDEDQTEQKSYDEEINQTDQKSLPRAEEYQTEGKQSNSDEQGNQLEDELLSDEGADLFYTESVLGP
ncbi:cilia- and flagella-associated protein 44 [Adelges cooleyi]|uniref:cilia- and flagella-associated protein 44 n=1 Tax=Adelges cooleyi TaxID=133065 RepID=UPI0021809314|nr:cilia- and flagella-associated protein 44 [Adelges cooleyi]